MAITSDIDRNTDSVAENGIYYLLILYPLGVPLLNKCFPGSNSIQTTHIMNAMDYSSTVQSNYSHEEIRVVFFGDSLVGIADMHYQFVSKLQMRLSKQFPTTPFQFFSHYEFGSRIKNLWERLDRHVFIHNPHAVVMYWSADIADVKEYLMSPEEIDILRANYQNNLIRVIRRLQASDIKVIVCGPTLIGERPHGQNDNDAKIDAYRVMTRRICHQMNVDFIDTRSAFFGRIPQADIICGLSYTPFTKRLRLRFTNNNMAGALCLMSHWMTNGVAKLLWSFNLVI
eukprot:gene13245-28041_t